MPRKFKTAFTATDEDVAITGIHDGGFIPRIKDGRRGFEMRIGGGTSIMPRVAPTLYEFVGADDGEYLKVTEAVLRIFNRQEELRANRARARIKVLIDRIGMDAFREHGRGGAARRLGRGARLRPGAAAVLHDEEAGAPAPRAALRRAQRRCAGVRALRRRQHPGPAPGRLRHGRGARSPAAT